MKADLHTHSTVSDGSDTIGELVEKAKAKSLDAIAITEHDTLSHLWRLPDDKNIQIIGGVEISAVYRKTGARAHILGYHIVKPEIVTALTRPVLEARNRNSEKQAEILIKMGYKIDMDRLPRADGKYLYKQHIMDWLTSTGQVSDFFGEFYMSTFKNGGVCCFDINYIDVFDAVKTIKEAGGLAVLAHPGQQRNFAIIPELARGGLDGLELNHHTHDEKDREILKKYAAEHGLFLTGGSDAHGRYEPQPYGVGDFLSEESGTLVICRA